MKSWNKAGKAWLIASALLITAGASQSWGAAAANSKGEVKCQAALTKTIGKQLAAVTKAMAACKNRVLAAGTGTCPDATATAAIDKAAASAKKTAAKSCQSKCSVSFVSCIANPYCPPNDGHPENCTDQGKNIFDFTNMGFPGAFCEAVIGHSLTDPDGFGECAAGLGTLISTELLDNVYGGITTAPSAAGATCLAAIAKAAPTAASQMSAAVAKCRNTQLASSAPSILPDTCLPSDTKTVAAVNKARQKFVDAVGASCTVPALGELDLCGAGIGALSSVDDAKTCLGNVIDEISDSIAIGDTRSYAAISIINGAYPKTAAPRCGDNLVNQLPNQFLLLGEECDGIDDTKCPGHCLPPGDLFECTCGNIPRARTFADGFAADLDNGWTGASHNSKVTDGAGFISDVTNCQCSHFDPAHPDTCDDGVANDKVCDTFSEVQPRCTNHIGDHTSCDQVGNNNGSHTDSDCQTCDSKSANGGDYCTSVPHFCLGGTNNGDRCSQTADCTGGTCTALGVCLNGPFAGAGCNGGTSNGNNCGVCTAGTNVGASCTTATACGVGGVCQGHDCTSLSCVGGTGSSYGGACVDNADCNTGERCAATTDCTAQCYPTAGGPPTKTCAKEGDCATGERCQGVCDLSAKCLIMRNGAPLPLSAKGTSTCIDSQFFTNATGTKDIVTGEHAVYYELRSHVLLSNEQQSVPCPVCGGYCYKANSASTSIGKLCNGTCSAGPKKCRYGTKIGQTCASDTDCDNTMCDFEACRFDTDCTSGTCDGTASPDCGTVGLDCRLDLSCSGGPLVGQACRIEAATAFGTTSSDCPSGAPDVSASGLAIKWLPLTSGAVTMPNPGPCDAQGYENYDCNCVKAPPHGSGDSTRTKPNECSPACNAAGPNFGHACTALTTCVGGLEAGAACDQDSDCSGGGTCSGNPRACGAGNTGGTCSVSTCVGGSNDGTVCFTNTQCTGGGTCNAASCVVGSLTCTNGGVCDGPTCSTNGDCDSGVTCDDTCPSGRCTPLCVGRGKCNGGNRDGQYCALDVDCTGGGTCVAETANPALAEEGACAVGHFNHCDGKGWEFISCAPLDVGTQHYCEAGTDGIPGNDDDNVGAGYCRADITNCYVNGGAAVGGSTLNGKGDPTNQYSVAAFCIPPSTNSAVNSTAGLPGPGRIRQPSLSVPNFTHLP